MQFEWATRDCLSTLRLRHPPRSELSLLQFPIPRYSTYMEIVNFPPGFQEVGAGGICPHCAVNSYFKPVGVPYRDPSNTTICNAAQCQTCKNFVLIVGVRQGQGEYRLRYFYPLGKPNDRVDAAVPPRIAEDFKEALRCQWIDAYKATVTMCRRVIQASCLEQKADKAKRLVAQIDELAAKGTITQPLREFAHAVRLEGNDGAHPDPDGLENVTAADAEDIISFTREYLHHVYVMPEMLARRRTAAAPSSPPGGTA